tara:strand:- start:790 stop:1137 length:348 start_codon:yes stop_codon:yes gene_type:complete
MEEKFLSIYLTASSARSLLSTKDVVGVDMASTSTVKIWYKGGRTATLTLNAAMATNNNDVSNFLANEIAQSHNPNTSPQSKYVNTINQIATPFPNGILNGAGTPAAVTVTSIVIA